MSKSDYTPSPTASIPVSIQTFYDANLGISREEIDLCLGGEGNVNRIIGSTQRTILMQASMCTRPDLVKYLIENGADVNIPDADGRTAILYATEVKHYFHEMNPDNDSYDPSEVIVRLLLGEGANVNVVDARTGYTPLMNALGWFANFEIIKLLVKKGAEINVKSKDEVTPFLLACSCCDLNIIKFLEGKGANINDRDNKNETALVYAITSSNLDVVKYLVERGADLEAKSSPDKSTPLIIAASLRGESSLDIVKILIENGADIDAENSRHDSALANSRGNNPVYRYLLTQGAKITGLSTNFFTTQYSIDYNGAYLALQREANKVTAAQSAPIRPSERVDMMFEGRELKGDLSILNEARPHIIEGFSAAGRFRALLTKMLVKNVESEPVEKLLQFANHTETKKHMNFAIKEAASKLIKTSYAKYKKFKTAMKELASYLPEKDAQEIILSELEEINNNYGFIIDDLVCNLSGLPLPPKELNIFIKNAIPADGKLREGKELQDIIMRELGDNPIIVHIYTTYYKGVVESGGDVDSVKLDLVDIVHDIVTGAVRLKIPCASASTAETETSGEYATYNEFLHSHRGAHTHNNAKKAEGILFPEMIEMLEENGELSAIGCRRQKISAAAASAAANESEEGGSASAWANSTGESGRGVPLPHLSAFLMDDDEVIVGVPIADIGINGEDRADGLWE